jgi:predicted lysophospholipase L1 biosynthesis ABC-type transport system permease subunit
VSSKGRIDTRAGPDDDGGGHAEGRRHTRANGADAALGPSARILRRRQEAARARRRRLLRADLALALLLALLVLVLAPGLAIAAILALAVLATCGAWAMVRRWRTRGKWRGHTDEDAPRLAAGTTRYRVGRHRRDGAGEEERKSQRWT